MADTELLDFSKILTPISEENPTGVDLREDFSPEAKYYALQELRTDARAAERAAFGEGEENDKPGLASWKKILKEAPKCLIKQSKDLEVASWLAEALVRLHGYEGLLASLELLDQLVTTFGSALFPQPDEDGIETQISAVMGLSGVGAPGSLIVPLNCAPLISLTDGTEYSAWDHIQAKELEKISDQRSRQLKIDAGVVEISTIKAALEKMKPADLQTKYQLIEQCLEKLQQLNDTFNTFVNDPSLVSFSHLRNALQNSKSILQTQMEKQNQATQAAEAEAAAAEQAGTTHAENHSSGTVMTVASGSFPVNPQTVATREQALEMLQKIVDFFREAEPHSPVSYGLEKMIRWARMALPDLVAELIQDGNARMDFYRLSGIKPPALPQQPQGEQGHAYGMGEDPMGGYGGHQNDFMSQHHHGGGMGGHPPGMGGGSMFDNDF